MNPLPLLGAVALFTLGAIVLLWGLRLLRVQNITGGTAMLGDACKEFVSELPVDPTPSAMAASAAALPPRPARTPRGKR